MNADGSEGATLLPCGTARRSSCEEIVPEWRANTSGAPFSRTFALMAEVSAHRRDTVRTQYAAKAHPIPFAASLLDALVAERKRFIGELKIRRRRTPAERALLMQDVTHLLLAVAMVLRSGHLVRAKAMTSTPGHWEVMRR